MVYKATDSAINEDLIDIPELDQYTQRNHLSFGLLHKLESASYQMPHALALTLLNCLYTPHASSHGTNGYICLAFSYNFITCGMLSLHQYSYSHYDIPSLSLRKTGYYAHFKKSNYSIFTLLFYVSILCIANYIHY